jgi:hypothetical protein
MESVGSVGVRRLDRGVCLARSSGCAWLGRAGSGD